jgi:hypothetical protein
MIDGTWEIVLTIRIAVPPGQSPQAAGAQVANSGVMIPLGLMGLVKHVDVNVVPAISDKPKLA